MYVGLKYHKTESSRRLFVSFFKGILVCVLAVGCAERPSGTVDIENNPPAVTIVSPPKDELQNKSFQSSGVNASGALKSEEFPDVKGSTDKPPANRKTEKNSGSKSNANRMFEKGTEIVFEGYAVDLEEDTLSKSKLKWTSNLDGSIGEGEYFIQSDLSVGDHQIILTATDSEGGIGRDTVEIAITDEPDESANGVPSVQIHSLNDGWSLLNSAEIILKGSAEDPEDGILEEDHLVWSSNIEGKLGTGSELDVTGELSIDDHVITLVATDSEGAAGSKSVNISIKEEIDDIVNESPVVNILSLSEGESLLESAELILKGTAEDLEDGTLDGESLIWSSDVDGELGMGTELDVTGELSIGDHTITLTATDSEGASGEASVNITFEENIEDTVNELPVAKILDVDDILELLDTEILSLEGSASDPDGEIVSMKWSSDIDGELGTGATLEISAGELTLGDHTITFTATDNDGATDSDSVEVTIEEDVEETINKAPVAKITSPEDGESLNLLEVDLVLEGTGEDPEDGTLEGESLIWSSNREEGELGKGSPLDVTNILSSTGDHTITLTVIDSEGTTSSDSVNISILGINL